MKRATMTKRKDDAGKAPESSSSGTGTAFDQWLNRGLHQMFDDVMNEPVPEALLRLLRDDKGAGGKDK